MTFGQKLKRYREEKGMTQESLAELVGTQKQNISRFENYHIIPRLGTAKLFAQKLNLPLTYLLDDNIVTEDGLDLSDEATRRALWRYVDADEYGTPILVFSGLCNSEDLPLVGEQEERKNQEYREMCDTLIKNPLGREEVRIIMELRRQPELCIGVKRILGIE